MPGRVCVIGSANMDLVIRAPRLPGAGETVLGGPFATHAGGKGANQAVAAARMGAHVTMVGRVGADAYGNELRALLSREGVDLTAVRNTAGVATGVALITVAEESGENTIVVAGGANRSLSADDVRGVAGLIRSADVILMQTEIPLEAVCAAATVGHSSGRRVVLNAAPATGLPPELVTRVHVLVVNNGEAAEVAGMPGAAEPEAVAAALHELGHGAVVITLGAEGALVSEAGRAERVPSVAVDAVDTVGAGDAVCGAIAAMLAAGESLVDATRTGCVAGALAATRRGAIPSLPSREVVARRLEADGATWGDR